MASTPQRTPESEPRTGTTIGKAVKIVGQIITKEDLCVDGDVEGSIESEDNRITIGLSGQVQASIHARDIVIFGKVRGEVVALDKVDLRKDAKLEGDITSSRVSIEDGAFFKGKIDTVDSGKPIPKRLAVVRP